MAALCQVYAAQVENGKQLHAVPEGQSPAATDVMVTASGLLEGRQPGSVRARHVAELDRAAEPAGRWNKDSQAKKDLETLRRNAMDLIADRGRRVTVEELNTTQLLAHARKQAVQRKFDDMLIVDVDAHHYENEHYRRHPAVHGERRAQASSRMSGRGQQPSSPQPVVADQCGFIQDMGGRVTRYPLRGSEKTQRTASLATSQLGDRWMDAMSVDYSCLFPTGMLNIGLHPQKEMEVRSVLGLQPLAHREGAAGIRRALVLDADACRSPIPTRALRQVETFGDRKGVDRLHGHHRARTRRCNDNALHEGLSRASRSAAWRSSFHSGPNWYEPVFKRLQPLPVGARARLHASTTSCT